MNYVHQLQRAALYNFKRKFGVPIDIYKLQSSATDPQTGQVTTTTNVTHIARAVFLCGDQLRKASGAKDVGRHGSGARFRSKRCL